MLWTTNPRDDLGAVVVLIYQLICFIILGQTSNTNHKRETRLCKGGYIPIVIGRSNLIVEVIQAIKQKNIEVQK